jgi:hypothetical protein
MQQAFGTVIIVVVILGAIIAVVSAVGMGRLYDEIGHGGLSLNDGLDRPAREPTSGAEASRLRDDEIRQLLEARNAVRIARGKAPLDVQAEMAALARPKLDIDPELYEEVRVLVEMRNRRRVGKGQAPLDVDAEIERQLRDVMPPPAS